MLHKGVAMTDFARGLALAALLTGLGYGQPPTAPGGLPVKRVVLYKNGVGYFELVGRVQGNQDVAIPFTSGQLNDVLKSLTLLDLGGGRITAVGYGSSAPVERQLGDLRLPRRRTHQPERFYRRDPRRPGGDPQWRRHHHRPRAQRRTQDTLGQRNVERRGRGVPHRR